MRYRITFFPLLLLVSLLSSCINFGGATYLGKKSEAQEFPLDLSAASDLTINGPFKVVLVNGTTSTATMTEEIYKQIRVRMISEGKLAIQPKETFRSFGTGFFQLTIGIDSFKNITINTDQPFKTEEFLQGTSANISLTGITSGVLQSNIKNLTLFSSTPKLVKIVGTADSLNLTTSDTAYVNIRQLVTSKITINAPTGAIIKD